MIWGEAYNEEYDGLQDMNVFATITEEEYQKLIQEHGDNAIAIPSMNLFTVKKDKCGNPVIATSRIVVLGNLERRIWLREDKYAPVLNSISAIDCWCQWPVKMAEHLSLEIARMNSAMESCLMMKFV